MLDEKLIQINDYLRQLVPGLEDAAWQAFADRTQVAEYRKGDVLLKPGAVCNYITFINKGLIRSYYLIDGKEMTTAFVGEDCYFSDYESFLSRQPVVMYSEVLEDTEVVNVHYNDLQELYTIHAQCQEVGRLIAEYLFVFLSSRVSSFLLNTPEERYLKFIEENELIINRVPQYMIASYLGITPEALSRIRSRMSRKKTVQ